MIPLFIIVLLGNSAAHEVKGVIPVAAERQDLLMGDLRFMCITVTFDLQTIFRTILHNTTLISPSGKNDFIVNMTFSQNDPDLTLSCITIPTSQSLQGKPMWQKVKQCYKYESEMPHPDYVFIANSTVMDLYQAQTNTHKIFLLDIDVPVVGELKLALQRKDSQPCKIPEGLMHCLTKHPEKCSNGCIDVCPYREKNAGFQCLAEPEINIHKHKAYHIQSKDSLFVNLHTGKVSFIMHKGGKLVTARSGDQLLQCPPPGLSKQCDYISSQGICMVRSARCSVRKVPSHIPNGGVYVRQTQVSFRPATLQPFVDPMAYCFAISRKRGRKYLEMCTKWLMSVPKNLSTYIHQHQFVNGTLTEDKISSQTGMFIMIEEKMQSGKCKHTGPFILTEVALLAIAVGFFLYTLGKHGGY